MLVKNNLSYWLMRITMLRAMREKCVVMISVAFLYAIDYSFAGDTRLLASRKYV